MPFKSKKYLNAVVSAQLCLCAVLLWTQPSAQAAEAKTYKIGLLASFAGVYAVAGQDCLRGAQLALDELKPQFPGYEFEFIKATTDGTKETTAAALTRLVDTEHVRMVIGPLSGDEGLAVRDFARQHPNVTFVNGSSGAQGTTLNSPAPNFFRFSTDGAQMVAGLGDYVFKVKGYKNVVIVGENYSFPHSQVFGFMHEFCRDGGHVKEKFWVPIGTVDFSSVISKIPKDVDAIFVTLGGSDVIHFLDQYSTSGKKLPLIGGSIAITQDVLQMAKKQQSYAIGMVAAGPIADDQQTPEWLDFVGRYTKAFPDHAPTMFATAYYTNTKALLLALKRVGGDSDSKKLQEALAKLEFLAPYGPIKLDKNRNGITNNYVTELAESPGGKLINRTVRVVPKVNQTLGDSPAAFAKLGDASATNPNCP